MIRSLLHVGVTVPDLEVGRAFYDLFGLQTRAVGNDLVFRCEGRAQDQLRLIEGPRKKLSYVSLGTDEQGMRALLGKLERAGVRTERSPFGDIGSAVAMKLINNTLVAIHTLAAAEAMNMGTRAGFDPHRVAEVLRQGSGSSAMLAIRAPLMASRNFTPAPGPFETLRKYLELGAEMARELGCSTPLFSTASAYFFRGLDAGMAKEDIAAVIKLIEAESTATDTTTQ